MTSIQAPTESASLRQLLLIEACAECIKLGINSLGELKDVMLNCPDRTRYAKLYEAANSLRYEQRMQEHEPYRLGAMAKPRDMGIDCISRDGERALQAKLDGRGTTITFTAMATFHTASSMLGVKQELVVCPPGTTLAPAVRQRDWAILSTGGARSRRRPWTVVRFSEKQAFRELPPSFASPER